MLDIRLFYFVGVVNLGIEDLDAELRLEIFPENVKIGHIACFVYLSAYWDLCFLELSIQLLYQLEYYTETRCL